MKKIVLIIMVIILSGCGIAKGPNVTQMDSEEMTQSIDELKEEIEALNGQIERDKTITRQLIESNNALSSKVIESEGEIIELRVALKESKDTIEALTFDHMDYEVHFINGNEQYNTLTYLVEDKEMDVQTVNIIGSNFDHHGESFNYPRQEIKGLGELGKVKFIITGTVYDFALYALEYPESESMGVDTAVYEEEVFIGEITNQEILVETTLGEGLPLEAVKWKNADGKEFIEYISYDGLGVSGRLRISQ